MKLECLQLMWKKTASLRFIREIFLRAGVADLEAKAFSLPVSEESIINAHALLILKLQNIAMEQLDEHVLKGDNSSDLYQMMSIGGKKGLIGKFLSKVICEVGTFCHHLDQDGEFGVFSDSKRSNKAYRDYCWGKETQDVGG